MFHCNLVDMSTIGFDCIGLGRSRLDSVVFHSGLKAMTSSVLRCRKLWPDSVQFANATPQPLFRVSVQLRIDRMHPQKICSIVISVEGTTWGSLQNPAACNTELQKSPHSGHKRDASCRPETAVVPDRHTGRAEEARAAPVLSRICRPPQVSAHWA